MGVRVNGNCNAVQASSHSPDDTDAETPRPERSLLDNPALPTLLKLLPRLLGHTVPWVEALVDAYEILHATELNNGETKGLQKLMDSTRLKCPPEMPTITFTYARYPTIVPGIQLAQAQHPEWKVLTIFA